MDDAHPWRPDACETAQIRDVGWLGTLEAQSGLSACAPKACSRLRAAWGWKCNLHVDRVEAPSHARHATLLADTRRPATNVQRLAFGETVTGGTAFSAKQEATPSTS